MSHQAFKSSYQVFKMKRNLSLVAQKYIENLSYHVPKMQRNLSYDARQDEGINLSSSTSNTKKFKTWTCQALKRQKIKA